MTLLRLLLLLALSSSAMAMPSFVQCFDFGCKSTLELQYTPADWKTVRTIFDGIEDVDAEKQAIRKAIALMEEISGRISGTHLDKGGNYPGSDIPKQMDCIDESTNTYQYLNALEELGLLRWHSAGLKYHRIVWFIDHWTASIREIESERVYAVDSWYRDNGKLPYLQPIEDWKRKRDFPEVFNPELAASSE